MVRTRGLFSATLISGTTAGDGFFGAVGIAKVSDQAFTAGIGSMPTPLSESFWDGWLWHSFFDLRVASGATENWEGGITRLVIDSKAMRKFDANEVLYAAFDVVLIGTAAMNVFFDTRLLLKHI